MKLNVDVDAEEGRRRRREDDIVENRKSGSEESPQKKRRESPDTVYFDPNRGLIPSMVASVQTNDDTRQLEATTQFRKLLSRETMMYKPPIDAVVQAGVVPRFVEFLKREDFPQLQFEAAWTLTNIAYGTSEHIKVIIDHGAVPIFVKLLASPSDDVREQAVWALGNVAGDSSIFRDIVLANGALGPLLVQLNEHAKLSMLRNATWALSNFCRGRPHPPFEQIKAALPFLQQIIQSNDDEVITDACWALYYISDGTNETKDEIQAVIDSGVCPRLVELLLHPSEAVVIPVLRTVGNIVAGDDVQTQFIVNLNALPCLLKLLDPIFSRSIRKGACWTISNITTGNRDQIQAVMEANIILPLFELLKEHEPPHVRKEAAWAIANATSRGTRDQINYLVSMQCIKLLCDLLVHWDLGLVFTCLEGLENILKVGEAEKKLGRGGDVNRYAQMIDEAQGVGKIENLYSQEGSQDC